MRRSVVATGLFAVLGSAVALSACAPAGSPAPERAADGSGAPAESVARFGFGTAASDALVAAWDIDVGPDGAGLPAGRSRVADGLAVFATKCAACHGPDGTGGPNDRLAGRIPDDAFPFATDPQAPYTVGSYWPYATTLFDYIRKAMPFDAPGSLTDEEVYGAVGAVLHFNDLLTADAIVDSATIADLRMPSRDRFVRDDRGVDPAAR